MRTLQLRQSWRNFDRVYKELRSIRWNAGKLMTLITVKYGHSGTPAVPLAWRRPSWMSCADHTRAFGCNSSAVLSVVLCFRLKKTSGERVCYSTRMGYHCRPRMIHGVGTDDTRGGIDIWFVLGGVYLQTKSCGPVTEHLYWTAWVWSENLISISNYFWNLVRWIWVYARISNLIKFNTPHPWCKIMPSSIRRLAHFI